MGFEEADGGGWKVSRIVDGAEKIERHASLREASIAVMTRPEDEGAVVLSPAGAVITRSEISQRIFLRPTRPA